MKIAWKKIHSGVDDTTWAMKVPGGMLIRTFALADYSVAMAFVPCTLTEAKEFGL